MLGCEDDERCDHKGEDLTGRSQRWILGRCDEGLTILSATWLPTSSTSIPCLPTAIDTAREGTIPIDRVINLRFQGVVLHSMNPSEMI